MGFSKAFLCQVILSIYLVSSNARPNSIRQFSETNFEKSEHLLDIDVTLQFVGQLDRVKREDTRSGSELDMRSTLISEIEQSSGQVQKEDINTPNLNSQIPSLSLSTTTIKPKSKILITSKPTKSSGRFSTTDNILLFKKLISNNTLGNTLLSDKSDRMVYIGFGVGIVIVGLIIFVIFKSGILYGKVDFKKNIPEIGKIITSTFSIRQFIPNLGKDPNSNSKKTLKCKKSKSEEVEADPAESDYENNSEVEENEGNKDSTKCEINSENETMDCKSESESESKSDSEENEDEIFECECTTDTCTCQENNGNSTEFDPEDIILKYPYNI